MRFGGDAVLSRLATSFVLAYHGCDKSVAENIVARREEMKRSEERYDWLGSGIYFWESDPLRAWEWADDRKARNKIEDAAVIGAAIDLGNCLDLMARPNLELVKRAYSAYKSAIETSEQELLTNRDPQSHASGDRLLRELDCAVINTLHALIENQEDKEFEIEPFDSVRGLFQEDAELYPGAGFRAKTHIQIAVRNLSCIKGVFLVDRP